MAETTAQPPAGLNREMEEAGFYHEAALNGAWTGSRLAIGGLSFLFGSFVFAYFYLRSLNSSGRWHGSGFKAPSMAMGTVIMALVVVSALVHYLALQRIKGGSKRPHRACVRVRRWPESIAKPIIGLGSALVGEDQKIRRWRYRIRAMATKADVDVISVRQRSRGILRRHANHQALLQPETLRYAGKSLRDAFAGRGSGPQW